MSKQTAPVIVIFGITGDLSKRKLLPALYHLMSEDLLPADSKIVGSSRHTLPVSELAKTFEESVIASDEQCDATCLQRVVDALETIQLDPSVSDDFNKLKELLDSFDQDGERERLFYMSIPATAYAPIVKELAKHGLNDKRSRLLLEKPFGYDYESARKLINLVNHDFDESQIYRIDHYLAKETAQNLLTFRLHNPIFVPLWNSEHVKRVRISASETLGVEGRANFYEQTGALRDFTQSHLMQLLSIVLMDLPTDMSSQAIHRSKHQFFEQLLPADTDQAVRGQYKGYKDEVGNPDSFVETYASVTLRHASERWRETEIVLETGKALADKTTDITIEFNNPHERRRNNLIFHIQPNEGISLDLIVKEPGFENHMRHTSLDFSYKNTFADEQHIDAYERVLMDAVRGDQALFSSDQEVLATWRVLQPIIDAWQASGQGLILYEPGTANPEA